MMLPVAGVTSRRQNDTVEVVYAALPEEQIVFGDDPEHIYFRRQFPVVVGVAIGLCLTLLEAFAGIEGCMELCLSPWFWIVLLPFLWLIAPYFEDYFD